MAASTWTLRCCRPVRCSAVGSQADSHAASKPAALKLRVRKANLADTLVVAKVCTQAFRDVLVSPATVGALEKLLPGLDEKLDEAFQTKISQQVEDALRAKAQASQESREYRLRLQSLAMRAELARIRGQPSVSLPVTTPAEKRQLASWQRNRMFSCLVAEDADTREVLGCVAVSTLAVEAVLPAPFPTSKPARAYVSNMAVAKKHQRKGVAKALLKRCERLGQLWGFDSVWLHVDASNTTAQQLYTSQGFEQVPITYWLNFDGEKYLLKKQLPAQQWQDSAQSAEDVGGATRRRDGVFVWERTEIE